MRTFTYKKQSELTPDEAFDILHAGNHRFVNNLQSNRNLLQQVNETREGQYPFAAILSCMDSRTSVELIFDQGLGDILSMRIAGNVLNEDFLGCMEYSANYIGIKLLVVLGHSDCGAIIGACDNIRYGSFTKVIEKIQPAIDAETKTTTDRNGKNKEYIYNVTENNVHLTLARIRNESKIISDLENNGVIRIVGGLYDVETGHVDFFDK